MILLIMYLYTKYLPATPTNIINMQSFVRRAIIILALMVLSSVLIAQPYFDPLFFKASGSPDAALFSKDKGKVTIFNYVGGIAYPVVFKKDSSRLLLGAVTEHWSVTSKQVSDLPKGVQSLVLPVSFIKRFPGKFSLALSVIPRWNGLQANMFNNSFQIGGSVLATYKKNTNLTYRLGVYYNREFFGPFIIPLLGVDWRISKKDNLFGVFPQLMTYEHRVSEKFSFGAVYRMFNNSYRIKSSVAPGEDAFMRFNEMQLLLSTDFYLTKRIAFNVEAGHSLFRNVRLGLDRDKKKYYSDEKVNNGFVVKAGLVYRIRLR